MRDLEVGDLSLIVRKVFGLPEDADAKITERLKHMRKLAFPSASRVGQGYRRTYGVEDVLKVAVAFQLIDAGLASALAVALVVKHWPTIAHALVAAIGGGGARVGLTPNVVTDLSRRAAKPWDGGGCVVLAGRQRASGTARGTAMAGSGAVPSPAIVLDLALLVRAVRHALKSMEGVSSEEIEDAIGGFHAPVG